MELTNITKIAIGILVVVLLVVWGYVTYRAISINKNSEDKTWNSINMMEYFDNTINQNVQNTIENNNILENKTNTNTNTANTTQVTGQEEKNSTSENTEYENQKKAIELAQKEWGISINSYNFEPTKKSDGIYEVSVRNKTTTYVEEVYTVNIQTGAVTEAR